MKVNEILELSFHKQIASIAKDHLTIGEKALRSTLKEIGCEPQKGKKGWIYKGAQFDTLDKSIYEFVQPSKREARANQPTNVIKKRVKSEIEQTKKQAAATNELTNVLTKKTTNVIRKRSSFDIDVELMKELKIQAIVHDRNVYEIVETAIKKYLNELNGQ